MAQGDSLIAEGAGARGIGWPKKADHGNAQGRRQVKRTGIGADKNPSSASKRDQLSHCAADNKGISAALLDYTLRQVSFSWACIHQRLQVVPGQGAGHRPEALGWPLLGIPSCAGRHQGKAGNAQMRDLGLGPNIRRGIARETWRQKFEFPAAEIWLQGLDRECVVLLDHVLAGTPELLRIEHASRSLTGI